MIHMHSNSQLGHKTVLGLPLFCVVNFKPYQLSVPGSSVGRVQSVMGSIPIQGTIHVYDPCRKLTDKAGLLCTLQLKLASRNLSASSATCKLLANPL